MRLRRFVNIAELPVAAIANMGRKFKGNRGGKRGGNRGNHGDRTPYTRFPEIVKENERLERYYNTLMGLPEEEKEQFWTALKRELPNSFRFCGSKGHALSVKRLLQTRYIPEITDIGDFNGEPVNPPQAVPWYPDSLAWWMTTPKNVIRKFPPFSAFQRFLVSETTVGNISRQEVVSMIPPLLMDLRPGMTVLDMCAAPGSKAAQLLEMIHRGEESRIRKVIGSFSDDGAAPPPETDADEGDEAANLEADPGDDGRATGMLIANDSDYKRSHMLIHQLKRLSSPNMMVTNHDATLYPAIKIPNPQDPSRPAFLKFDRILADVPCSGDGTLRKNVAIWKDWLPGNALGLHATQVRILVRALSMLKPGGRVVYSTCSMNPVENEAVVAAAIDRCGGSEKIEIVDCSNELPLLKRKPGLKVWQVMDKAGRIWDDWEKVRDFAMEQDDGATPSKLSDTMFPKPDLGLPLERCIRVYPHMQDTGAFFITVLHKKAEFKARPDEPKNQTSNGTVNGNSSTNGSKHARGDDNATDGKSVKRQKVEEESSKDVDTLESNGEAVKPEEVDEPQDTNLPDPVIQAEAKPEEDAVPDLEPGPNPDNEASTDTPAATKSEAPQPERKRKQQGPYEEPFKYLDADHPVIQSVTEFYKISPRFPKDRFLVRNAVGEPAKAIYYTSALVRDILVANEGRGVKFIHGGVKMFVKQDVPSADICRWRIQSEGMPILHGYVGGDRVVVLRKKETLKKLLIEMFPRISNGAWERLDEVGERVRDIGLGCSVLRVEPEPGDEAFAEHMALPLWKSFQSLNLMLPKEDRSAMLLRIYNDTTPLVNMGIQKGKDRRDEAKVVGQEGEGEGDEGNEDVDEEGGVDTTIDDAASVDTDTVAVEVGGGSGEKES